jgi:branched-subunit amino acid aminotransferase/4-amino-4-deoxychorismate lyase
MEKVFAGYEARQKVLEASTNPFADGVAWVQGKLVPVHEARIPLMDQGFLHSDLTYDVPSVWDGRFFRLDDHLDRFELSCSKMRLKMPLPREEVKRLLVDMVAKSGIKDAFVEIIVTRGLKGVRGLKAGESLTNNLYMWIQPYIWVMDPNMQRTGGSAIIARTVKRTSPGSMDPTVKNLQWGDLTRGMLEAQDRGADYPFLTDGDGNITEGSGFNVVFIKDGVLYTPDRGVLKGVTRKSVGGAAKANGIEMRIEFVPTEMAYQCDECFMCTTAGGVMPITTMDGQPIGDGKIGPVTKKIWDTYWAMHYDDEYSFKIDYEGKSVNGTNGTNGVNGVH